MNGYPCQHEYSGAFGNYLRSVCIAIANENGVYHFGHTRKGSPIGLLPCVVDAMCPKCGKPIVEELDPLAPDANIFTGELWRCLTRVELIGKSDFVNPNWQNWNWYCTEEWRSFPNACKAWSRYRRLANALR